MSEFLGIDLIAGLNETQSLTEINKTIGQIQESTKLKKLELEIKVDEKVLQSLKEFNQEIKKLSQTIDEAQKKLDSIGQNSSLNSSKETTKTLNELKKQTEELGRVQERQGQRAQEQGRKQLEENRQKLADIKELTKETRNYNKENQLTSTIERTTSRDGAQTTVKEIKDNEVVRRQEIEDQSKALKSLERIYNEQEKVYDKIDKIRFNYGDNKQLKLFEEKAATQDINVLKNLSKEISNYDKQLGFLSKKDETQKVIKSLKTLYKNGAIRLPKKNMLTDIEEMLANAKSVKDIDNVNNKIKNLTKTLSDADKGIVKIERLREDGLIERRKLTEARSRIAKAESPEQSKTVLKEIERLEEENRIAKKANRELEVEANKRQNLMSKILQVEEKYGDTDVLQMFRRQASEADKKSLQQLSRNVSDYEKELNRLKQLENEQLKIFETQQSIFDKIDNIRLKGYADEKQLKLFEEKALTEDANALKELTREIGNYDKQVSLFTKRDELQKTVQSMKSLHEVGLIRLPEDNFLTNIEELLQQVSSHKDLDVIGEEIKRWQKISTEQEKGLLDIEKLKADSVFPLSELSELEKRLMSARDTAETQLALKDIKSLKAQNEQIKKDNRELELETKKRNELMRKLAGIEQRYGIKQGEDDPYLADSGVMRLFNNAAVQGDRKTLELVSKNIDDYEKHLGRIEKIEKAQRRFLDSVFKLESQLAGTMTPQHTRGIRDLADGFDNLTPYTKNLDNEINKLNSQFGRLKTEIVKADQGMARFSRQLASAMVRVPIYAATIATMYAPLNALRNAIQQTIEIDSQMTVLERVSNGAIKANEALEESVRIAEKLGNTITEVNDGLISFARQGFRGEGLAAMAEYATIMSNVSDLTVDEAASSLTAAMKGFNIEAEDSIRIVDALNEVNVNQPPCTVMYM